MLAQCAAREGVTRTLVRSLRERYGLSSESRGPQAGVLSKAADSLVVVRVAPKEQGVADAPKSRRMSSVRVPRSPKVVALAER